MSDDRSSALRVEGFEKLRTPRRCAGCGAMTHLKSKLHKRERCYECVLKDRKATTSRPFKAMCAALCLLLLLAGCQAPRVLNAEIQVAGQQVKVSVMR